MKAIARIVAALAVFAILVPQAWASGFYMPPWAEVLFILLLTPEGWAVLAVALVALVVVIYKVTRR